MNILGIVKRMLLMFKVNTVNSRSSAVTKLVPNNINKNGSLQTSANYCSLLSKTHILKHVRIRVLLRLSIMVHISKFLKQHLNTGVAAAILEQP